MQDKNAVKCSLPRRLKAVRLTKHLTWDGLAALLEISPSMIYQVRRGDRNLGDLALHRLEKVEIAEGLLKPSDATLAQLSHDEVAAKNKVGNPSHDAYIRMRLECLANIIDTYDSKQMGVFLNKVDRLTKSEIKFGKIFIQLAEVVVHLQMRKQWTEDMGAPPVLRKNKM